MADPPARNRSAGTRKTTKRRNERCHGPYQRIKKYFSNSSWTPDPYHWPELSHVAGKKLGRAIAKYKFRECRTPTLAEFRHLAYDPPLRINEANAKIFIYGVAGCAEALRTHRCWALIVDSTSAPQNELLPLINTSLEHDVPVVCLFDLKRISFINFGVAAVCLGLRTLYLPLLRGALLNISNKYRALQTIRKDLKPPKGRMYNYKEDLKWEDLITLNPTENAYRVTRRRSTRAPVATVTAESVECRISGCDCMGEPLPQTSGTQNQPKTAEQKRYAKK